MSLNKTQFLRLRIRELARDYFMRERPAAEPFARLAKPTNEGNGLSFEYNFVQDSAALLVGDPAVMTQETDTYTNVGVTLGTETLTLNNYDIGIMRVSESTADAFTSQVEPSSASDYFVRSLLSRAYVAHSRSVRQAAEAQLATEVIVIDADYADNLQELIRQVELESRRPNAILMDPMAVDALAKQDFVRDFPSVAVAINASGDQTSRRSGWANEQMVAAYFLGKHQLQLVVDDSRWKPTIGAPVEFVMGGAQILGYTGAGLGIDTLSTAIQYSGEIVKVAVRENSGTDRIGFNVPCEGIWKIHGVNPESGRIILPTATTS